MEPKKSTFDISRLLLDTVNTYEETADAIVPDTFPDLMRIAAVFGTPQLKDDVPQSGRVFLSGSIRMTVFYVPEGGGLRKLDIPVSFAHIQEAQDINERCQLFASCRVVSADARIMNSRKLSVTATLCISCQVFCPESLTLTTAFDDADENLEILSASHLVTLPVCACRKEFTLMDDVNLADFSRYSSIAVPRAELRLSDCRLMNEKAIIKGDAVLHLLAETTDGLLENADCVLSFTQIVEAEGMKDDAQLSVRFAVRHLDAELRDDGLISVGLGVSVLLTAFETLTLQTIEDVYHLQHPVQIESRSISLSSYRLLPELGCEASETLSVGMKIAQIADVTAVTDRLMQESSPLCLRMMVCVVYRAEDGCYYSMHRAVQMPLDAPAAPETVRLQALQCRASAAISGEDSIVLSLSGRCSVLAQESLTIRDLTTLTVDTEVCSPTVPVSVILRYMDAGERLWDIAKSYRTTVDAIRQANQLTEDVTNTQAQMLLIPVR